MNGEFERMMADSLDDLETRGLRRTMRVMDSETGPFACAMTVLSSNDYLDLARDGRVKAAAEEALCKWGAGTGGSRLTTGTQPPHVELEEHLASFKGTEAALTFSTGYMANIGVLQALAGKGDTVFSDELNHASIIDGCRLSGARIVVYRHCDMEDLDLKLRSVDPSGRKVAVSDGVFSMDGDMLNLPAFLETCRRHGAVSVVDEAHATGVVGKTGRGLHEHFGCDVADVTVGTMSKALGSTGGFACGSRLLRDFLANRARSFIFSTAPGAAASAAASAALGIIESEPWRVSALQGNVSHFLDALKSNGLDASSQSAIVPVHVGDETRALAVSKCLEGEGFLIPAIRYPTVASGAARLRVAIMSSHDRQVLERAAAAIASNIRRNG